MDARHDTRSTTWLLFGLAWMVGAAGALPYAGSWNDGSRLAAVESLAERHTLAIDDSIFVEPRDARPYRAEPEALNRQGTQDKLWIDGHFYSDKPAVISVLMALLYQAYLLIVGVSAAARPDWFCWFLTAATSGLAYALAVVWMERLGRRTGLHGFWLGVWLASFGLSTIALTYTRHVNNHILLLAVVAGLMWHLLRLGDDCRRETGSWFRLAALGSLTGLGYNLDLGAGPVLVGAATLAVAYRTRRTGALVLFFAGMLPWLLAHHAVNYAIGGVIKPMNTVPEYLAWPGSPFSPDNLTGFLRHGPGKLLVYALALLFGKHGFIGHNLPLFLTLPAGWLLMRGRPTLHHNLEGWTWAAWVAGTFAMYAVFSNNYGGACCSVRWFVPLLAPGFWLLAWLITRHPEFRGDFLLLSAWGLALSAVMWAGGPWILRMVPCYWFIQAAALLSWLGYRVVQFKPQDEVPRILGLAPATLPSCRITAHPARQSSCDS